VLDGLEQESREMAGTTITRVGIVGAGTMGSRIAYRSAVSGLETYLYDAFPEALGRAMDALHGWLSDRVSRGELTGAEAESAYSRVHVCDTLDACVADIQLVIETVPENVELKREVFAEIDKLAPPQVLIATNSSSLPCSRLAEAAQRPDKVFNVNFSDPRVDDLVEVMKGVQTSEETLAAGVAFVRALGMVPIVTYKEIMGFSFNRVWRAIKREMLHLVADGYSSVEDLDRAWMLEFHMPYGPFGLMDAVGLDVIRDIEIQYYLDSGQERDKPPQMLEEMVAQGHLGVKSGRGFYTYPNPAYEQPGWLRKEPPWDQ
jgi:3-hydroxybutyryl-CoA dehydrogenase